MVSYSTGKKAGIFTGSVISLAAIAALVGCTQQRPVANSVASWATLTPTVTQTAEPIIPPTLTFTPPISQRVTETGTPMPLEEIAGAAPTATRTATRKLEQVIYPFSLSKDMGSLRETWEDCRYPYNGIRDPSDKDPTYPAIFSMNCKNCYIEVTVEHEGREYRTYVRVDGKERYPYSFDSSAIDVLDNKVLEGTFADLLKATKSGQVIPARFCLVDKKGKLLPFETREGEIMRPDLNGRGDCLEGWINVLSCNYGEKGPEGPGKPPSHGGGQGPGHGGSGGGGRGGGGGGHSGMLIPGYNINLPSYALDPGIGGYMPTQSPKRYYG